MELLKLEYFRVVAKLENVSKAAKELNISQPALSKAIKDLEIFLGYELFERKKGKIFLNDNGRIILKYANYIFNTIDDATKELADYNNKKSYPIRLSLQAISNLIIPIVEKFNNENGYTEFIINQNANNKNDFDLEIFTSTQLLNSPNISNILIEPIDLIVPLTHPLASRDSVKLEELADEKFIALTTNKPLRQMTDEYCKRVGFTPKVTWETDSPQIIRQMVGICNELAFIPTKSWELTHYDKVKRVRVENDFFYRYIYIGWYNDRYLNKTTIEFRDFLIKYFESNLK